MSNQNFHNLSWWEMEGEEVQENENEESVMIEPPFNTFKVVNVVQQQGDKTIGNVKSKSKSKSKNQHFIVSFFCFII